MKFRANSSENDNIDNLCYSYFNSNRDIPIGFKNNIQLTCQSLKNSYKPKTKFRQAIIYGMCIILLTSGVVYAKDIKNFVTKFFFGDSKSIQNAIDNDYILNSDMNYIESDNIKLKVSEVVMDDYILGINFSLQLDESLNKTFTDISFKNILISDENKNILYCNEQSMFDEYCSNNHLNDTFGNFNSHYINSGLNYYSTISENYSEANCIYNFYSNGYPKSQKLYINIRNLMINDEELNCHWKIELDIPEKFYNREVSLYTPKESNYTDVIINNVSVYNTTSTVQIEAKLNSNYEDSYYKKLANNLREEGKSSQEITDIINAERKKNNYDGNITSPDLFEDIYIKNSNDEIFYQDFSLIEGNTMVINKENLSVKATFSFELTKYNMTDELYLHFIYNGQEFFIELVKK